MPVVGEGDTFCCNRMFLWDDLCFTPTFYACNARSIFRGLAFVDSPSQIAKFLLFQRNKVDDESFYNFIDGWIPAQKWGDAPLLNGALFQSGASIAFIMVQLAVWLGYTQISLLGVDHKGVGHCFDPDATKSAGFVTQRDEKVLPRWANLLEKCDDKGIDLIDCTPDGYLSEKGVLAYVPLEEILHGIS